MILILISISFILLLLLLLLYVYKINEKWSNTYSGWPGPLESPFKSNIPALYGNPKYESTCSYKKQHNNSPYYTMRELP